MTVVALLRHQMPDGENPLGEEMLVRLRLTATLCHLGQTPVCHHDRTGRYLIEAHRPPLETAEMRGPEQEVEARISTRTYPTTPTDRLRRGNAKDTVMRHLIVTTEAVEAVATTLTVMMTFLHRVLCTETLMRQAEVLIRTVTVTETAVLVQPMLSNGAPGREVRLAG